MIFVTAFLLVLMPDQVVVTMSGTVGCVCIEEADDASDERVESCLS